MREMVGRFGVAAAALGLILSLSGSRLAAQSTPPLVVSGQFDYFLVDGKPRFLVLFSYFDAMRATDPILATDFAWLRDNGIHGVRIFANWWNWGTPPQTPNYGNDTLMDSAGNLRADRLARLKTVLTTAKQYGLVVDLSFACETVQGLTLAEYTNGLVATTHELTGDAYRHVFFDLQNESTHISCNGIGSPTSDAERLALRNAVRNADPMRMVTASLEKVNDSTATTVGRAHYAGFDMLAYHDPRESDWYNLTDDVVSAFRTAANCPAHLIATANSTDSTPCKPFYLQEPSFSAPNSQAFITGVLNAKSAGAAAFTFHTQHAFDLRFTAARYQLTTAESGFVTGFRSQLNAVNWEGDGMKDTWSSFFGIATSGAADQDGDGVNNLTEFTAGTHANAPTGLTRYFADGRNNTFFGARLAFANPYSSTGAAVLVRLLKDDGSMASISRWLGPLSSTTIEIPRVPGMRESTFAVEVETTSRVIVDRTIGWDRVSNYGAHLERNIIAPSTTWYFAEGTTSGPFDTELILRNPNASAITVSARYLLPGGAQIVRSYAVAAGARRIVPVDAEPGLGSTDFSSELSAGAPFLAERSTFLTNEGRTYNAGAGAAGVANPSLTWIFAEGTTGPYFDTYMVFGNPSASASSVVATYRLPNGTPVTRSYTLPANSRTSVRVDSEDPALADTDFWVTLQSTNSVPFVAERVVWWPDGVWREAHASAGETGGYPNWAVAEGEHGLAAGTTTYVVVANTSGFADTVTVTALIDGVGPVSTNLTIGAFSRLTVNVAGTFPQAGNRRFGVTVRSLGGAQLVVERSMYWNANGISWANGANAMGTRF